MISFWDRMALRLSNEYGLGLDMKVRDLWDNAYELAAHYLPRSAFDEVNSFWELPLPVSKAFYEAVTTANDKENIMATEKKPADNPNAAKHREYYDLVMKCKDHPMLHDYVRSIPGKDYKNFEGEAFVLANAHTLEVLNLLNLFDDNENPWDNMIMSANHLYLQLEEMVSLAADAAKAEVK